jgi:BASS family bile acid:Na+ symporter
LALWATIVSLDQIINLLVVVTLVEMMVAIGLGVSFTDLVGVVRNGRLVAKAVLANYVCVPAAAVGLLLLFHASAMAAAGYLILAVCPGAPYGPPLTAIAKGNVPASIGLMVVLAGSSALVGPLLLYLLLPVLAGDTPLHIHAGKMVGTLLATQLAPLCVGLGLRHWCPVLAARLQQPATLFSKVLNLLTVGGILATQYQLLAEIPLRAFVGMAFLLAASLAAGWLLGGPGSESRKAMGITTSLRNVGVGLVIATGAFAGTPAMTAVLAYGLFGVLGSLLAALAWGRQGAACADPARWAD